MQSETDFLDSVEKYWLFVGRHETEIRENVQLGRVPPMCLDDLWDGDFAAAYEALRPFLHKLRRDRFYPVPPGLPSRPGPIRAETAHQGLMFYLNPSADLRGQSPALAATEYLELKTAVMRESALMQDAILQTKHQRRTVKPARSRRHKGVGFSEDALCVHAFLMQHHGCEGDEPVYDPVRNQDYIVQELGGAEKRWNQSRVSRAMKELMAGQKALSHLIPMERYRRLCEQRTIVKVLIGLSLQRYAKGIKREFGVENLDRFGSRGY